METGQTNGDSLAEARKSSWHQAANPLLSIEALREWVRASGLVLYGSRAAQLGAPAPSLVEAVGGDEDAARTLLARLVAEGGAVPLNLLGAGGGMGTDAPDFVASAGVFSYVFTLRGNKAWKQAPLTSGPVKVTPLALAVYEMLAAKVTLSAYDLTTQLGGGVTEASVLRALTELWGQLRVLPMAQPDGQTTLWELATARFTKQIKSGANAGQPSALSALISLYLGQALAATEDEIESFLSPLASRSRVRDVVHALMAARQLETMVVAGKTLLYVAGQAPGLAGATEAAEPTVESAAGEVEAGDAPRIKKFTPKPGSKIGTGLRAKPAFGARPSFGAKPAFGRKPAFGAGPASGGRPGFSAGGDRERRPFRREGAEGGGRPAFAGPRSDKPRFDKPRFDKPRFDKPWEENRPAPQPDGIEAAGNGEEAAANAAPAATPAAQVGPRFGKRFASTPRPGGARFSPRREGPPGGREGGAREGYQGRDAGGERPERRFAPGAGERPARTFSKPGTFGRKRENAEGGERPPRRDFSGGSEGRPPRRDFGGERGGRPGGGSGGGFKRPGSYTPGAGSYSPGAGSRGPGGPARSGEDQAGGAPPKRVFRKFDAPKGKPSFGAKPFAPREAGDRPAKSWGEGGGAERGRPSFGPKPGFAGKPAFGGKPKFGGQPAFGERSAGGKKPFGRSGPSAGGPGAGRPGAGGFSSGRPGAGKPAGPFAKFADGKRPFRKPGAGGGRPGGGKPGGGRPNGGGGFAPVKRNRPGSA